MRLAFKVLLIGIVSVLYCSLKADLLKTCTHLCEDFLKKQLHIAAKNYPVYSLPAELKKPLAGARVHEKTVHVRVLLKTLQDKDECTIKNHIV
jgi:hypothetical protein